MSDELIVLRDLSDDEINNLSEDEIYNIGKSYDENGFPVRATVKGLLDELDIKYDDLSDFVQGLHVGVCNSAKRTGGRIYINRKGSPLKDNIIINLDKNIDAPYVTIQLQVREDFIHEEAYSEDGLLIYRT